MTEKRINELTAEQEKYLPVFRQAVLKKALCTDPIDQEKAKAATINLYVVNGREAPEIVFTPSPYEMVLERERIRNNGTLPAQINVPSIWFSGAWDNYWLAFYQFGAYLGVQYKNQNLLDAYQEFCDQTNVALLYEEIAILSDRPSSYRYDAQMRLHAIDDYVVKWRDGFGWCSWKGLAIPDEFIFQRDKIDSKKILGETNAEFRRVLIEIYGELHGPKAVFKDLNAKLISEDKVAGFPRKLYDINGSRYIHVINGSLEPDGSRREFLLGVQNTINTPAEAIATSYGIPSKKYKEVLRS